jgi:hypothetical protein
VIRPALLALLLLVALPAATRAQPVSQGMRVRVMAPAISNDWISGTVERADSAALRLRVPPAGGMLLVPAETMRRMQASRGRAPSTLQGAIMGGTLGALAGFLTLQVGNDGESCARGCGGASGGGFLIGVGAGAVVGALIGSRIRTGPERWREVPLPMR